MFFRLLPLLLLLPAIAFAQPSFVRNDSASTSLGVTNGNRSAAAVDSTGKLFTAGAYAEDTAHSSGDFGQMCLGVVSANGASVAAAGDYAQLSVGVNGAIKIDIDQAFQRSQADALLKAEDSASANTEALVGLGLVRQSTLASSTSADGDWFWGKGSDDGAMFTQDVPGPKNGLTRHGITSAASNNATSLKASAGQLYQLTACNNMSTVRYVKLYDKATAPTCGTDTPALRFRIPPESCPELISTSLGISFSTGIAYCIVTLGPDSDNTAVGANEVFLNIGYK